MTLSPHYQVDDSYKDFVCRKSSVIEELQMVLYEFEHGPSGARVIHLAADDPENLFCISMQTLPSDSTGVAHILEHTVLCGSKKFPVKDPFFSMSRRSLNTFMNAMTGADFTCYPAASQVEKDFYNLLEVYLDAVFYPELKKMSFLQEGHRLEFDPHLMHKGVVYNEMKGSLSNPETRLWHEVTKHLTPDLTYAVNSGGDPKEIPHLTFEELKAFHATYYHPSRSIFFFYGNLPLEKHLDFLTRHVLKGAEKLPPIGKLPKQERFSSPQTHEGAYPDDKEQEFVALGWLTTSAKEPEEGLALALLDSILMENDASPLKEALIKSGLCTQADGYLDSEMSEFPYVIICRGCKKKSHEALRTETLKTLEKIAKEGIDERQIEGALHQLEFSRLEITGDYGPFGLTLFMRSILPMQHGCAPEDALTVYSQFKKLKLKTKDPQYLPSLIKKYFLENPHFLTLRFHPDKALAAKEEREEAEGLKKLEAALSQEEKEAIVKQTTALEKFQEKTENQSIECLPKIGLEDVPKETLDFLLHHEQEDQLTIFHHECFTNHIAYARLLFDLPQVPYEDLSYLQLFISLIPELGAGNRDYRKNLEYINAYLGDFETTLQLFPQAEDPTLLKPAFGLKGKALTRNIEKLFSLFSDVCQAPGIEDTKRIKELILQLHTSLENRLSRSAMGYAIKRSIRLFSSSAYLADSLTGLKYFQFIREIAANIDQKLPKIIEKFKSLKSLLFHFTQPHLVVSSDSDQYRIMAKEKFYGLCSLPSKPYPFWEGHSLPPSGGDEAYPISSPVAFTSMGMGGPTLSDSFAPALSVSTDLLENTFLHQKIREQGGAYGAGASYNPLIGSYYIYAYRDPHITATLKTFEEGLKKIAGGKFTERDLTEAKLGIIQDLDSPVSPGSRGMVAYSHFREGHTKAMRQEFRDHLLSATKSEVKDAVKELLDLARPIKITFAGETLIRNEKHSPPLTSL